MSSSGIGDLIEALNEGNRPITVDKGLSEFSRELEELTGPVQAKRVEWKEGVFGKWHLLASEGSAAATPWSMTARSKPGNKIALTFSRPPDFASQAPTTQAAGEPQYHVPMRQGSTSIEAALIALRLKNIVWKEKRRARGRMNRGTDFRVATALLYIERRGHTQSGACQLAGVSPKTLTKWRDHPEVLAAKRSLEKDWDSSIS